MTWTEHVAYTGKLRTAYKILVRKQERKYHLGDLHVYGK